MEYWETVNLPGNSQASLFCIILTEITLMPEVKILPMHIDLWLSLFNDTTVSHKAPHLYRHPYWGCTPEPQKFLACGQSQQWCGLKSKICFRCSRWLAASVASNQAKRARKTMSDKCRSRKPCAAADVSRQNFLGFRRTPPIRPWLQHGEKHAEQLVHLLSCY